MPVRRTTSILLLAGFFASCSGLALAVHLHQEGPGHHLHQCIVYQTVAVGGIALPDAPMVLALDAPFEAIHQAPAVRVPTSRTEPGPIAPRAPPLPVL